MRKERTSHVTFENIQLLELLKVRSQQLKNIFHPAPRRPATMKRAEVPAKESTNPVQLVQSVQPAYPVLPGATINVTGKPEVPAKQLWWIPPKNLDSCYNVATDRVRKRVSSLCVASDKRSICRSWEGA